MKTEHDEFRGIYLNLALPKLIVGLAILVLGVIFALDNFNLVDADNYLRFWPAVLVILGLTKILGARPGSGRLGGWILLGLGLLLLGATILPYDVDFDDLWPVALLIVGSWLVYAAVRGPRRAGGASAQGADVSGFAFMGGNGLASGSQEFRGGDLAAVMGGLELDLRSARLHPEGAVLDVFAMWGGIEIHVPEGWTLESQVLPVMAAYEDSRRLPADSTGPRLLIRGVVLMGGIEVNNKPTED